jgi:hypothetical protein
MVEEPEYHAYTPAAGGSTKRLERGREAGNISPEALAKNVFGIFRFPRCRKMFSLPAG